MTGHLHLVHVDPGPSEEYGDWFVRASRPAPCADCGHRTRGRYESDGYEPGVVEVRPCCASCFSRIVGNPPLAVVRTATTTTTTKEKSA